MMYPTVHMNGTSRQELLDQVCDTMTAITNAIRVLEQSAPNARDYYPQNRPEQTADPYRTANAEHCNRVATLAAVNAEFEDIAEHIAGQSLRVRDSTPAPCGLPYRLG